MFHIMWNSSGYGTLDLVEKFMVSLRALIPLGTLNRIEYVETNGSEWDAQIRWDVATASLMLGIEVKVYPPRQAPPRRIDSGGAGFLPVLVAPFLSKGVQRALEATGWSYWDATGNVLLLSTEPWLAIRLEGATKDPTPSDRESTALKSLKGRSASEVMVGLLQNGGRASTIRDFAREHQVPLGSVSRVVSLLREENYIEPTGGGPIVLRDRLAAARRWADDYSFTKTFNAKRYFSISGPQVAMSRIAESGLKYGVTGVRAAQNWLGAEGRVAGLPSIETWLFVSDLNEAERAGDLAADPKGGQILVAECDFLDREIPRLSEGLQFVTPWRAVGDLLSAGGRTASVGEDVARDLIERLPAW
jgi:hypothetical protein